MGLKAAMFEASSGKKRKGVRRKRERHEVNPGVEERNRRDQQAHLGESTHERLNKVRKTLVEKTKLYNALRRGEGGGGDEERHLVDFEGASSSSSDEEDEEEVWEEVDDEEMELGGSVLQHLSQVTEEARQKQVEKLAQRQRRKEDRRRAILERRTRAARH